MTSQGAKWRSLMRTSWLRTPGEDPELGSAAEPPREVRFEASGRTSFRRALSAGILCAAVAGMGTIAEARWRGRHQQPEADAVARDRVTLDATMDEYFNTDYIDAVANPAPEQSLSAMEALEDMAPQEDRHDGNRCADDEEEFEGLCYKTCALLTKGQKSIRTTPISCKSTSGGGSFLGQVFGDLRLRIPCTGYDVAGDSQGGGCPHSPGACLENEEMHIGLCYRKCSLLTRGKFPHRVAAATCCKSVGTDCMEFWRFNSKTTNAYAVGGGYGDHEELTPSKVHPPIGMLTESGDEEEEEEGEAEAEEEAEGGEEAEAEADGG